ncbi:hypothetical protein [Gilvibacter sp.]|uniref:hypothetical protein n=1 Tax=Gilvibacter sp. TaxID=2729997 RepID=UPI003F4A4BA8
MSKNEKRSSIIGSISNWIKLMALIVLVAEVIILLAMSQTPVDSKLYVIYPIMMFLLLLIVIGAVIFDRTQDRRSSVAAISSNNQELQIDPDSVATEQLTDDKNKYTNSLLGYEFDLPTGQQWHEPRQLNYHQYFSEITLQNDIDQDAFNKSMMTFHILGPSFVNADILSVMHGETVVIEMNENSSTQEVENRLQIIKKLSELEDEPISDEDLQNLRVQVNKTSDISQIQFNSKLEVWTFPRVIDNQGIIFEYKLASFFQQFLTQGTEFIDSLIAEDDYILWTTGDTLKHVKIKDSNFDSFRISRWYRLHRSKKFIYLVSLQWSPEFDPTMTTWDKIKESFESFKIKK